MNTLKINISFNQKKITKEVPKNYTVEDIWNDSTLAHELATELNLKSTKYGFEKNPVAFFIEGKLAKKYRTLQNVDNIEIRNLY